MNELELEKKLIRLARATPMNDQVPFAFEKRIISLITTQPAEDIWTFWSRALWKAAAPCVGVMLLMGAWAALSDNSAPSSEGYSTDLESAVLAPLHSPESTW